MVKYNKDVHALGQKGSVWLFNMLLALYLVGFQQVDRKTYILILVFLQ